MIKASVKMVLSSKPLSNGEHSVYLRIIKDRKQRRIALGMSCKKNHFDNELFTKEHPDFDLENETLLNLKSRALKIIREFRVKGVHFTLKEFEFAFRGQKMIQELKVEDFFNEVIDEMKRSGRISNAEAYKSTKNSILKFSGKDLIFQEITPRYLEKYKVYLRENGNKDGGINFKMRYLRALFNKARQRGLIAKEPYPFEDFKLSKLRSNRTKRALSINEFKKIKKLNIDENPHLIDAYNYFLFSIYSRGMNFKDMMHLKWSDIRNNRIYYQRAKTKQFLNLEILPMAQCILDYYKNQQRSTEFVFPILLKDNLTEQQLYNRKQKVLRQYNSKLKEIALKSNVDVRLTTYVARHSFATILKSTGTSIEKISEMMGHANVNVTMNYLKEFSNEDLDEENRKFIEL